MPQPLINPSRSLTAVALPAIFIAEGPHFRNKYLTMSLTMRQHRSPRRTTVESAMQWPVLCSASRRQEHQEGFIPPHLFPPHPPCPISRRSLTLTWTSARLKALCAFQTQSTFVVPRGLSWRGRNGRERAPKACLIRTR